MNPRNRLIETLKGRKADRVPLMLEGFHFASRADVDAIRDPGLREIAHRIFDYTAYFVSCPSFVNRYLVTPPQRIVEIGREEQDGNVTITSEIHTPKGKLTAVTRRNAISHTVWTIKYPVESLDQRQLDGTGRGRSESWSSHWSDRQAGGKHFRTSRDTR